MFKLRFFFAFFVTKLEQVPFIMIIFHADDMVKLMKKSNITEFIAILWWFGRYDFADCSHIFSDRNKKRGDSSNLF